MQTFAEELNRVRKERKITQAQLSDELNVARQTVSHWENGRSVPDIDTIRRLSEVLDHNFLTGEENEENPAAIETEVPSEPSAAEREAEPAVQEVEAAEKKPSRRTMIPTLLGGLLVCVLLLIVLLPGKKDTQQANVQIIPYENPVLAIRSDDFPDGLGWFWGFQIEETAGVPFTISELTVICINDDGKEYPTVYTGKQCADFFGSDTLEQNLPQTWMGGFPVQRTSTVRLTISGKDANGNKLTFESSLELSKEVAE